MTELDQRERSELARVTAIEMYAQMDALLGEHLAREGGTKPDWDDWFRVGGHEVTQRCLRRAVNPADDYVDSTPVARRRVGLVILRHAAYRETADLVAVTRAVLDDPSGWPDKLWDWTRSLEPAARSAVGAAGLGWAAAVLRVLGGPTSAIRWEDPGRPTNFEVPGRLIRLGAPIDASSGAPSTVRLLSVFDGDGGSAERLRAAHVALVRTLQQRLAPVRVTVAAPSRGELRRFDVDGVLLQLGADRVVELAAARAEHDRAATRPGTWCRYCHLVENCSDGTAYLESL